jgi:hypothetical protein
MLTGTGGGGGANPIGGSGEKLTGAGLRIEVTPRGVGGAGGGGGARLTAGTGLGAGTTGGALTGAASFNSTTGTGSGDRSVPAAAEPGPGQTLGDSAAAVRLTAGGAAVGA